MTSRSAVKVLVLGATGMLGNTVLRLLSTSTDVSVVASIRSERGLASFAPELRGKILTGIDAENHDSLIRLFATTRPEVVVNCIGLVKQLAGAADPLAALPINSMMPHRLAQLCEMVSARLVHISTDCVFSGAKGMYREEDLADAADLYGRSKHLGEVDYPHAVTLRTSIIGHELGGTQGLLGWFLAQNSGVKGYTRAVFSGLPTVELARVIRDFVIPRPDLHGVYHVSAAAISKFDLLSLVARVYDKTTDIEPDDRLVIDRSLDSTRFRIATGYSPPDWPELVRTMRQFG